MSPDAQKTCRPPAESYFRAGQGSALAYSVPGLLIFAGFTMFDFQRLRTNADIASAPILAASIFLDILNVFLFFLLIFSSPSEV
jgi:FtsH-binding integral membrane protein